MISQEERMRVEEMLDMKLQPETQAILLMLRRWTTNHSERQAILPSYRSILEEVLQVQKLEEIRKRETNSERGPGLEDSPSW